MTDNSTAMARIQRELREARARIAELENERQTPSPQEKNVLLENVAPGNRNIGLITMFSDLTMNFISNAGKKLLLLRDSDIVDQKLSALCQRLELPHQLIVTNLQKIHLEGEQRFSIHTPITMGDRDLEIHLGIIRDRAQEQLGYTIYFQDISQHVQQKEELLRLKSAIHHAAEAIVITDTGPRIQYVNPAFEQITGYSHEEVQGLNPRVLQSGQQDRAFYKAMWSTLLAGKTWRGHFLNKKKDGSHYTEDVSISPVVNAKGKTTNYVAVKRDVTQEIALKEQLEHAIKMEAVGRLAGGIAHDFNNLLCVITGNASLLLDDLEADDSDRELMEEIQQAADRASRLTNQLLTFSRKDSIHASALNLGQIVQRLSPMLRSLTTVDVELQMETTEETGKALLDANQIEQVVLNLAINAIDAMPTGGVLRIKTASVPRDGASTENRKTDVWVMLQVSDTGSGMSPAVRERIFDPFFTTKSIGKGTGLGLSTVLGIVEQNHGKIEVDTAPEKGTTFRLYFPRLIEQ